MTMIPRIQHSPLARVCLIAILAVLAARACAFTSTGPGQASVTNQPGRHYYGTLIGRLVRRNNNVSGEVYAVDEQTLFLRDFHYDGQAGDTYFWSSVLAAKPSASDSFIVPDEKGSTKPLERYQGRDLVLRLPEGKTLREIRWLSVWSRQTRQSLADIQVSPQLALPRPVEVAPLSQLAHGLKSGPITIVDAQTLLVPDFHYDGLGPAAFFWLTRGQSGLATAGGLKLKDENGAQGPLRKYSGETLVISLPDDLTIYDFDFFGVWCTEFQVNFGQTRLPQHVRVPPSPKMLGIKPENKLNCEILYDELGYEIRWVLDGDDIVMQLVGKIEPGEYMAFGLGKNDSRSDMSRADAVVAWVDHTSGQVHAVDYYLGSKAQCQPAAEGSADQAPQGSCPDLKMPGGGDSLTLLHGAIVNGYSMVTFKRPQLAVDEIYDQHVYSDGQQSVLWAIGTLNEHQQVGYHRLRSRQNMFIDFARHPQWNCPIPDLNASMQSNLPLSSQASQVEAQVAPAQIEPVSVTSGPLVATRQIDTRQAPSLTSPTSVSSEPTTGAWFIPDIVCPQDKTLYAQLGPAGGPNRGYQALTGNPNWGSQVWYINGLLAPELILERHQTYRFIVEGGNERTGTSPRRNPFYVTDSSDGGFYFKLDDERLRERIFAGVAVRPDGQFVPTAEGRLCEWRQHSNGTGINQAPDAYPSFAAYQRSLKLECSPGQAALLKFTSNEQTPDTLYYQCYTHRFMGWRIRLIDSCAAYLSSRTKPQTSSSNKPSTSHRVNNKRDIKEPLAGRQDNFTTTGRRGGTARPTDPMSDRVLVGQHSEPRVSVVEPPSQISSLDKTSSANGDHNQRPLNIKQKRRQIVDANGQIVSSNDLATMDELTSLPPDALILNNTQLNQDQPFNISYLELIQKLSPSSVEIMDSEPLLNQANRLHYPAGQINNPIVHQLRPPSQFHSNGPNSILFGSSDGFADQTGSATSQLLLNQDNPEVSLQQMSQLLQFHQLLSQPVNYSASLSTIPRVPANNKRPIVSQLTKQTNNKGSKTFQEYVKRLASIYYPVQQQLTNILASNPGTTSSSKQHGSSPNINQMSSASSEQSNVFSLSSLMPKPKIDLSKANLSKKLSKLRLKSGRKLESQSGGQPPKHPVPAVEFNYDIINNQLAQLEHHKHLASNVELDTIASHWPGLGPFSMQQQDPLSVMTSSHSPIEYKQLQYHQANQQNMFQQPPVPLRFGQPLQNPGQDIQQENLNRIAFLDKLMLPQAIYPNSAATAAYAPQRDPIIDNSADDRPSSMAPSAYPPTSMSQNLHNFYMNPNMTKPLDQVSAQNMNLPQADPGNRQSVPEILQQPSIYVTRLPQTQTIPSPQTYYTDTGHTPTYIQSQQAYSTPNKGLRGSMDMSSGSQHANSHDSNPLNSRQSGLSNVLPSITLTIHDQSHVQSSTSMPDNKQSNQDYGESLNGSGSGSYYDFRQREPSHTNSQGDELDHMMAIERLSKQSSERQFQLMLHPSQSHSKSSASSLQIQPPPSNSNVRVQISAPSMEIITTTSSEGVQTDDIGQQNIEINNRTSLKSPKRYSSILIDKNIMATSEPMPATGPKTMFATDTLTEDLPRLKETKSIDISNNTNLMRQPKGSTTSPNFDLTSEQTSETLNNVTTNLGFPTIVPDTTEVNGSRVNLEDIQQVRPTVGPLIPSVGPPSISYVTSKVDFTTGLPLPFIHTSPEGSTKTISTIESKPSSQINSPNSLPHVAYNQNQQFKMDTSPFVPIELTERYNRYEQNLFRPPAIIESILSNHLKSLRPEPQNLLSPYLAHQLTNSLMLDEQQTSTSQYPDSDQKSTRYLAHSSDSPQNRQAGELIILKPTVMADQATQTYLLRPEYLQTQFHRDQIDDSRIKMNSDRHTHEVGRVSSEGLNFSMNQDSPTGFEAKRKSSIGRQFDRLSSLSSPPSASIALDPMQMAHSVNSYFVQQQQRQHQHQQKSASFNNSTSQSLTNGTEQILVPQQHRQELVALVKSIPVSLPIDRLSSSNHGYSGMTDSFQKSHNSVGTNFSPGNGTTVPSSNNDTDNAILSHVMSLISSNAVPVPPIIPQASFVDADSFMPLGEHINYRG